MDKDIVKQLLSQVPKSWVAGTIAAVLGVGIFGAWYGINKIETNVEDKTVLVCNTTQLEESVKAADKRADAAEKRASTLEALLVKKEAQIVERIVFRDRVVTKIEYVQSQLEGEDLIKEQLSPTSHTLMEEIIGDAQ